MKLVKISSAHIQIRSNDTEFEGIRINDLLHVSDGEVSFVAMVTGITNKDVEEDSDAEILGFVQNTKVVDCSVIGRVSGGLFSTAIEQYPTVDVSIRKIKAAEFEAMLSPYANSGFPLGDYVGYGCKAHVNGNKLFQRHGCIVGNTGSGKSEMVAKILEETAKLPGANVIVFDIHGEYADLSYAHRIAVGERFKIPIWLFGFNSIVSDILKIKEESATVTMTALRRAYYNVCPDGAENKPVFFDYHEFVNELVEMNEEVIGTGDYYKSGAKEGQEKTVKGDLNGKLGNVIAQLEDRMQDSRYSFLFGDEEQPYLSTVVDSLLSSEKPVKVIDLSEVPHDVAIPIIGVLTRIAYDVQRILVKESVRPLVLFCDEAHVYIPNNYQLSASQRRMVEIFEEIAKEGRKFGITLFPATQRPSELNKTILTQCGNFIVMKLNNENDKQIVKSMLPNGNDAVVDATTMFVPGDALVIGDASPIPAKVHVDLASERPLSRTIDFWDVWKEPFDIDLDRAVEKYLKGEA